MDFLNQMEHAERNRPVKIVKEEKTAETVPNEEVWPSYLDNFFKSHIISFAALNMNCQRCNTCIAACRVKCDDCRTVTCRTCDKALHTTSPFHKRFLVKKDFHSEEIPPASFVDSNCVIYQEGTLTLKPNKKTLKKL